MKKRYTYQLYYIVEAPDELASREVVKMVEQALFHSFPTGIRVVVAGQLQDIENVPEPVAERSGV